MSKTDPNTLRIRESIEQIKSLDVPLQKKRELLKQNYFELEVFNQADDPSDSFIDTE